MNEVTALNYKILARAMSTLRQTCLMPRVVNADFSSEAAQKGNVINIPVPTAVGTRDVAPSVVDPNPVDTVEKTVPIPLNFWRQTDPIALTDKEVLEIDANGTYVPMKMAEGVKSLSNYVNQTVHSRYVSEDGTMGIFGAVGTAGSTPFGAGVTDATNGRAVMNKQLIPKGDRRAVLDFNADANMLALPQFSDVEKVGERGPKLEGEIGRKFGIDWYSDDGVVTHVAGTINASGQRQCLVNNGAGYPNGTQYINVDNASVTGTIRVGDIISFGSHPGTYCVVANKTSGQYDATTKQYTFSGNAITGLAIYPPLNNTNPSATGIVDNDVITVKPTHIVNLLFHRDAFGFVNRGLQSSGIYANVGGSTMSTMTDPISGLTMRLEVKREHKQTAFEFDILWGVNLIRPELAVRLMG